jgi:hypothetical protein
MQSVSWLRLMFGIGLLAMLPAAAPARADEPTQTSPESSAQPSAQTCEVPPYLLATESPLSKVTDAVKNGRPLDVLVVGSRSSTINTSDASAYPARLQVALKEKLPAATVNLSVELQPKKTADELASGFVKLMEEKKPILVVWQTGTVDAMKSIDPDDFRQAVDQGVAALQNAGADVILMNLQYSPRTETMISVPPYLDNMRLVAQQRDVPLFDRFAMMQKWNEQGDFDLFNPTHGIELAKQVHDCIGRALAKFIIDAAHLGPAQQN